MVVNRPVGASVPLQQVIVLYVRIPHDSVMAVNIPIGVSIRLWKLSIPQHITVPLVRIPHE